MSAESEKLRLELLKSEEERLMEDSILVALAREREIFGVVP